jgi:NitT/TauT family transport system substrate-binding protein
MHPVTNYGTVFACVFIEFEHGTFNHPREEFLNTSRKHSHTVVSVLLLVAGITLSMMVSSCSVKRSPVRIVVNAWPPCELWYVAEQQGFFGNMEVDIIRFSTWTDNMKSLPLGDIDVTQSTYFNALYYRDKGDGGKIILKADTIIGGDGLVIGSQVKDGQDLKGRSIAVETTTDEHFLLYKALELFGLGEADVTLVSMTSVEAATAFIDGKVDACFTYEPYLSESAAKGNGRIIYTTEDIPDTMIDVLVASDKFLAKRPRDAQRLVDAYYRAQEWTAAHPDEAYALMAEKEGMEADDFGEFYSYFTFFTREQNVKNFSSPDFMDVLAGMQDFLLKHDFIKEEVAPVDVVWPKAVE